MSKNDTNIRALFKELGPTYQIKTIDFEKCLYCDFKNGFNVEISGVNSSKSIKVATMYLWFENQLTVMTIKNVECSATSIKAKVDELYSYSKSLIKQRLNNRDDLFKMKYPETIKDKLEYCSNDN